MTRWQRCKKKKVAGKEWAKNHCLSFKGFFSTWPYSQKRLLWLCLGSVACVRQRSWNAAGDKQDVCGRTDERGVKSDEEVCACVCINPRKDFLWIQAAWEFWGSCRRWEKVGEEWKKKRSRGEEVRGSEKDQGQSEYWIPLQKHEHREKPPTLKGCNNSSNGLNKLK